MSDDRCDLLCIDFDHAEQLRTRLPAAGPLSELAERLRVMGDPTRLRIAHALLVGDELCVCDLAWVVGSSQALVSHHLRQLRQTGMAESRRDGKLVMYRMTATGRGLLEVLAEIQQAGLEPARTQLADTEPSVADSPAGRR